MKWYLYLVSVIWLSAGACAILYTTGARQLARRAFENANPTLMGALPIVAGMLLILSVSATTHPWTIGIIGGLGILKGGLMIYNPKNWYAKTTHWYLDEISDQTHRLFGILLVIFGTALLSWIK